MGNSDYSDNNNYFMTKVAHKTSSALSDVDLKNKSGAEYFFSKHKWVSAKTGKLDYNLKISTVTLTSLGLDITIERRDDMKQDLSTLIITGADKLRYEAPKNIGLFAFSTKEVDARASVVINHYYEQKKEKERAQQKLKQESYQINGYIQEIIADDFSLLASLDAITFHKLASAIKKLAPELPFQIQQENNLIIYSKENIACIRKYCQKEKISQDAFNKRVKDFLARLQGKN